MSLFEETNTQPESFVQKLVQTKGEGWDDPETIAKGKIEADNHIAELERQLSELREDLNKQDYAKTLLEKIQEKAGATATPPLEEKGSTAETHTTKEADLESLIEQALAQRETVKSKEENIRQVQQTLTAEFGTEAQAKVIERAKELGMEQEAFEAMAATQPKAFLTLLGKAPAAETNKTLTSTVNTAQLQTSSKRDSAYYKELRKKDPKSYYTPTVQNQMLKDRLELGDTFF